jgi:hypothetical protein
VLAGGYLPEIDLYMQRPPDAFHNLVLTGNMVLHGHVVPWKGELRTSKTRGGIAGGASAMRSRFMFAGAAVLVAAAAPALAQQGAVELSNGTAVAQNPKLPKLDLTDAQREQIRNGVATENTDVQFHLKTTKAAKDFTPAVGAKLPKGVRGHSLPPPVLTQLPQLRDYKYVKMKGEVLIVNAMTKTIVDMVPETPPQG